MKPNCSESIQTTSQFNILELYSGIGGFHFAVKELFKSLNISNYRITAVDINTTANAIYRHNHTRNDASSAGCSPASQHALLERNIQSFSVKELDRLQLDLITMSPPCQPFSRLGLQRDLDDNRCDSFRHLMSTLPLFQHKPKYIMLENVKGFDISEAHELLVNTLIKCGYQFEEFLLSPTQFSIPNSRQRYYLIAKLSADPNETEYIANIHTKVPVIESNDSIFAKDCLVNFVENIKVDKEISIGDYRPSIEKYLESNLTDENFAQFELTDETLLRYHNLFDLVDRHSTGTNCFTKAYAHRIEGCGSILISAPDSISYHDVYAEIGRIKQADAMSDQQRNEAIVQLLKTLKLRYFTPREIANLMCFPSEFEFPLTINRKQQYRVLGNSVNVLVCHYLLRILLGDNRLALK